MGSRNVLVVGAGGREHALCLALQKSPSVSNIVAVPGNAGIASRWKCEQIKYGDREAFWQIVQKNKIDFVVVGPEAPLVEGVVDFLDERGVPAFGPTAAAARLEGSKVFTKRFAQEHGIPTASFQVFTNPTAARAYVRKLDHVPVIKADGLCAGKGVVVADDIEGALSAIDAILERRAFGEAGAAIVIEERLLGQEVSVQAMCDGERYVMLPAAQDHKRVGEGDTGLNTGGMGAYAPAPLLTPELASRVRKEIIEPTLRGMRDRGYPFRGVLYAGLMITPDGTPNLLEFNVRFGDPEAQVTLPLIEGDFADACFACATGRLDEGMVKVSNRHALAVVLAAHGYPGNVRTGDKIWGLGKLEGQQDVLVMHAGTRMLAGDLVTASGRVLSVVGLADTLAGARDRAYEAVKEIRFEGMHYRRDIGARALGPMP
jgi:phosphoribosylamine--glycine ligase